jgi:hypothetical protein
MPYLSSYFSKTVLGEKLLIAEKNYRFQRLMSHAPPGRSAALDAVGVLR